MENDKDSFYYNRLSYWLGGEQFEKEIIPQWLLLSFAVLIGLALLLVVWIKSLRYQVEARIRELKESEEKYRGIFNSTSEAIFIHDAETGAILDVNQPMLSMYGYTREEALQLNLNDFSLGTTPYSEKEAEIYIQKAALGNDQLFEWQAKKRMVVLSGARLLRRYIPLGNRG